MLSKTGKKMAFLPKRRPRKLPEKLRVRVVHRPPKGPVEFGKKEAPAKAPEVEAERPISIHEAWKSLPLKQKILTLIIICIVTPPIVFSMYWISTGSFPFLGPSAPATLETTVALEAKQSAMVLLKNATNYVGSYPTPSAVSYISSDGQPTTLNAYPGQVQVFFNMPVDEAYAKRVIMSNDGTVLAKIPSLGYYLVGVASGSEGNFIASVMLDKRVSLALPNIPATAKQEVVYIDETWITEEKAVPLNVKPGIIPLDYFINNDHGPKVIKAVKKGGGSVGSAVHIGIDATGITSSDKVATAIAAVVAGNNIYNPGQPTLIDLSSGGGGDKDYTLLSPKEQKEAKESWKNFVRGVLAGIAALSPPLRDNLVLTQSAGNENMPIGGLLKELRSDPKLKDVMENNYLVVGTTLGGFSNHDSTDPDMAIMNNDMARDGTSFAAPAALAIIQQVMKQTGVNAKQALKAAKQTVKDNPNHELILQEAIAKAKLIKQQPTPTPVTPTPTPMPESPTPTPKKLPPGGLTPARDLTGTWRSSIPGQGLIAYGGVGYTPDPKDADYVAHYDIEWNITQSGNIISGPVTLTFVKDAGKYRLTTLPPKTATGVWTGTVEGTKIVINFGDYQLTGSFTSDFITASFYGPEQVKEVPGGPEIIPQNIGWKLSLSRVW
jgi:hypothetical protein